MKRDGKKLPGMLRELARLMRVQAAELRKKAELVKGLGKNG